MPSLKETRPDIIRTRNKWQFIRTRFNGLRNNLQISQDFNANLVRLDKRWINSSMLDDHSWIIIKNKEIKSLEWETMTAQLLSTEVETPEVLPHQENARVVSSNSLSLYWSVFISTPFTNTDKPLILSKPLRWLRLMMNPSLLPQFQYQLPWSINSYHPTIW